MSRALLTATPRLRHPLALLTATATTPEGKRKPPRRPTRPPPQRGGSPPTDPTSTPKISRSLRSSSRASSLAYARSCLTAPLTASLRSLNKKSGKGALHPSGAKTFLEVAGMCACPLSHGGGCPVVGGGSCPFLPVALRVALSQFSGRSLHSRSFRVLLASLLGRVSGSPFVVGVVGSFSAVRCVASGSVFQLCSGSRAGSFFRVSAPFSPVCPRCGSAPCSCSPRGGSQGGRGGRGSSGGSSLPLFSSSSSSSSICDINHLDKTDGRIYNNRHEKP